MKVTVQIFVLVLALQVAVGSTTHHGQLLPVASTQGPAGCHQHGHKTPAPQPQNFVCCLSGHDSAIVQASPIVAPACSDKLHAAHFLSETALVLPLEGTSSRFISSGDPPSGSPLRI